VPRIYFPAGVVITVAILAGCGGSTTKTVIVGPPKAQPATAPKVVQQQGPKRSMQTCATGVTVNEHASCSFAENILAAYTTATEGHGPVYLGVESPTTHETYAVTCSHGGTALITCRTTDAEVTLTVDAVTKARANHPLAPAGSPTESRLITAYPHCPYGADAVTHEEREEGFSSHCLKPNGAQETGEEEHRVEEREEKQEEREGREPAWVKEKVEERERG
jgi:hypothetical protein